MGTKEIYDQAIFLLEKNNTSQAKSLFKKILKEDGNFIHAKFGLGICQLRNGELADAEKNLRDVINHVPNHYKAAYYLGLVLREQNRITEAIVFWKYAISIKPDFEQANNQLLKHASKQSIPLNENQAASNVSNTQPVKVSKGAVEKVASQKIENGRKYHQRLLSLSPILLLAIIVMFFSVAAGMDGGAVVISFFCIPSMIIIYWILKAFSTQLTIFEDRIEMRKGIIHEDLKPIRFIEIDDVEFSRDPLQYLTNDATVILYKESNQKRGTVEKIHLYGYGDAIFMRKLYDEIRDTVQEQKVGLGRFMWSR